MNPTRSAFIPEAERDWWHADTWEDAAKAMRDHYPMGCAVDTCSAAPRSGSHFCTRHANFMDRVARHQRLANDLAERADDAVKTYFNDNPLARKHIAKRLEALDDALDDYREGRSS